MLESLLKATLATPNVRFIEVGVSLVHATSSAEAALNADINHDRHRRQAQRCDRHAVDGCTGSPFERGRRRLPQQDRAARRRDASGPMPASSWNTSLSRASKVRFNRCRRKLARWLGLPMSSLACGRERGGDAEITVFDSVGFALEDYSALKFLGELTTASVRSSVARSTWCRIWTIRRICSVARSAPASGAGCGGRRSRGLRQPECLQMDAGLGVADAFDLPDALQHFGDSSAIGAACTSTSRSQRPLVS